MKSVSMIFSLTAMFAIASAALSSDPLAPLAPRPNGMAHDRPNNHILMGATIHLSPTETYPAEDNPAILIEDGIIVGVFKSANTIRLKPGYQTHQLGPDQHIYPGFIDPFVEVDTQPIDPTSAGTHHNRFVTPQRDALIGPGLPDDQAQSLRQLGFTAAMIAPNIGIFRGWSATVSTASDLPDPSLGLPPIHTSHAGQMMGFDRTTWKNADYPKSHMGVMSLMRQSFIDAESSSQSKSDSPTCLSSINPSTTTLFYDTSHELEALLAGKIASEFDHKNLVIVGSGTEHRRLDAIVEMNYPVIVPLTFPKEPEVWTINDADAVTLTALQHWDRAPANARWLSNSGLTVALTTSKLRDDESFFDNVLAAIERGLPATDALAMLTTNPASILNLDNQGTIQNGNIANLVITSADLFDPDADAKILTTWIDGRPHHINDPDPTHFDGYWEIKIANFNPSLHMKIKDDTLTIFTNDDEDPLEFKASKLDLDKNSISFVIDFSEEYIGPTISTAVLHQDGTLSGTTLILSDDPLQWTAHQIENPSHQNPDDSNDETENDNTNKPDPLPNLPTTPFGPYAFTQIPPQDSVLIHNATIWTQSNEGILENAWIIIRNGTIESIGTDAWPEIFVDHTIDAQGKHITPGLIDAHSHTGLFRFGVNESGQAVTSEVRIADSLDPGHIGWYRELAGGLTTAMLLHGSANPIGGQSQTVKLRWGSAKPQDMFFKGSKPGIKFALGENVKQSNWGDDKTTRYPQTRMGVETLIRDRFTKAREYAASRGDLEKTMTQLNTTLKNIVQDIEDSNAKFKQSIESTSSMTVKTHASASYKFTNPELVPPRDLELEALAQILAGDRLVHAHSYRQDEILMLCRIAEEFNFKIGTFQHGLETYKVAEIVKEHAIGASIFSDWWAYKVEVTDAIPYAGPINHEVGLLTSFNSDSDDLARRMNVEAAKALKYARASGITMTEQDALNFVTKNPAIQLGIIDRVGTLEVGKDADLVIWSGSPLSSMSKAEATFVDGRKYFSLEDDATHRETINNERSRLIQKILTTSKPDKDKEEDKEEHTHDPDHTIHNCNQQLPQWHTNY